jgi:hypothetical protein
MVVNRIDDQSGDAVRRLYGLVSKYPHFKLYDFAVDESGDLHAKAVVVDRRKAVVGHQTFPDEGF